MTNPSSNALALPPLGEVYSGEFPIGVAVEPAQLRDQGPLIAHHFRRLTAENSMKFGEICPLEGNYSFSKADEIADFARLHSMKMTGHTLVWHRMVPPWLFKKGNAAAAGGLVQQRLRQHIFTMLERYSDVIDNWDVVNEAISDRPGKLWRDESEDSNWHAAYSGEAYIAQAFEVAAEAAAKFAPHVHLYYNDYNIEKAEKRHKVIEMIRRLRQSGTRVDGVGIQGHINLSWPSIDSLGEAIEDFSAENLRVKISELDVSVYTEDDESSRTFQPELPGSIELEARVAERYKDVFALLRDKASRLTSVTLWGVSDDQSWLNGWPVRRRNFPLLFDRKHRPKAALLALLDRSA